MKPPYIPETWDWSKNVNNVLSPFEVVILSEMNSQKPKDSGVDSSPVEYDRRWADDF